MKLHREFYLEEDVTEIARKLLGKSLMVRLDRGRGLKGGIIVESEAYSGAVDKASHAFKNKLTNRTKTMFERGGVAYVYLCYGIHHLFNIVTNKEGSADAVLVRAIQPLKGINNIHNKRNGLKDLITLTNGPGKLTKAMGIDLTHNGKDLLGEQIWIEDVGYQVSPDQINTTKRIGVDYAEEDADLPWRFYLKNNDWISKK